MGPGDGENRPLRAIVRNDMATPSFGDSEFLVGFCQHCAKEVLTHVDLDLADNEILRCLHCDEPIQSSLRVIWGDEIETTGYALLEARSCGNGGGCSVSGCGARLRD